MVPLLLPGFLARLIGALLLVDFFVAFLMIFFEAALLGAAFYGTAFLPAGALRPEITQIYSSSLAIIYSYPASDSAAI